MAGETELTPGDYIEHHTAILTYDQLPVGHRGFVLHNDQALGEADGIIAGARPGT